MIHGWSDFVGQVVDGGYVLREFLGEDAHLAAFETEHAGSRALIRFIHADAPEAERFYRSWATAGPLSHDNLVRLYYGGRATLGDHPVFYVVSELPDDSLGQVIPERALTADETRASIIPVLSGLEYLHQRRLAHGDVTPRNIVAVGDQVKLTVDRISPGGEVEIASDMYQFGSTLVEMLTQRRPPSEADVASLPDPFRQVAMGCLRTDPSRCWTPADALVGLGVRTARPQPQPQVEPQPQPRVEPATIAAPPPPPAAPERVVDAPPPSPRPQLVSRPTPPPARPVVETHPRPVRPAAARKPAWGLIGAAIAGLLLILIVWLGPGRDSSRSRTNADVPASVGSGSTPQPPAAAEPVKPSPVPALDPPKSAAATRSAAGDWAVVAAIYREHEAAEKRAAAMRKRWGQFEPRVIPPKGQGRRYMVILGSGMSKDGAEQVLRRARAAGMPRDTYVTKVKGAG
jgi:outer membrane biosynthesis protein TonB